MHRNKFRAQGIIYHFTNITSLVLCFESKIRWSAIMTHLWIMLACMMVFFHLATQMPIPQGGDNQKAADSSKVHFFYYRRSYLLSLFPTFLSCHRNFLSSDLKHKLNVIAVMEKVIAFYLWCYKRKGTKTWKNNLGDISFIRKKRAFSIFEKKKLKSLTLPIFEKNY